MRSAYGLLTDGQHGQGKVASPKGESRSVYGRIRVVAGRFPARQGIPRTARVPRLYALRGTHISAPATAGALVLSITVTDRAGRTTRRGRFPGLRVNCTSTNSSP
jgi:hypothetical protein